MKTLARKRSKKVDLSELEIKRDNLIFQFKYLPRKNSFSGWALADEIENINRQLEQHSKKK